MGRTSSRRIGSGLASGDASETAESGSATELVGEPYPLALIPVDAKFLHDYTFRVWFADGFVRDVDMDGELEGEVFRPLKDKTAFARLRFDAEHDTVVWPNGAD